MRSRILKVFLLFCALAIVVAGVVFLLLRVNSRPTSPKNLSDQTQEDFVEGGILPDGNDVSGRAQFETPAIPATLPRVLTPEERFAFELVTTAKDFAARYGSFSTHNPYQNYHDLFPLVTPRLRALLEAQIKKTQPVVAPQYLGILSRAYSGRIIDFAPGRDRYRVEVDVQRMETKNSVERTFHQTITLTVVPWNEGWLVDEAVWQPVSP